MNTRYRLWLIDFDSAMTMEEGLYILQSYKEPTEKECVDALYENTYTGTIYFNSFKEIFEKDFRNYKGRITLMNMDKK